LKVPAGKFAPSTVPAVFAGWVMDPGMVWKGDYLAAPIADFSSAPCGSTGAGGGRQRERGAVVPGSGKAAAFAPGAHQGVDRSTRRVEIPIA